MKRSRTIETTTVVSKKGRGSKKSRAKSTFGRTWYSGKPTTGFPASLRFRHRWCTYFTLSSTAGALATYRLSCNGLYDPDVTSAGTQPLYFDQLAALYNHYTVEKSKITVQGCAGNGQTDPMIFGVFINDDATVTPTTAISCCEQTTCAYTHVITNDGNKRVSKKWDAKNAFGPNTVGDPNLQGTSAANPTEQQVFTVFAQSTIATPSAMTVTCFVTIEFDTVWQELKDIAAS